MLTNQENERLCRVGRGTPMGTVMRRYWIPALASAELPRPDCPPVYVQVLNEDLVAFRDSEGRVGILNELCPHRGASLVLGRTEDCGLRCLYHGWKFGVEGEIQETPNLPNRNLRDRVVAPAYCTREAGGLIWVYLGDPAAEPAFPAHRFFEFDEDHRLVGPAVISCNYATVLEGGIDSSHLSVLHGEALRSRRPPPISSDVGSRQAPLLVDEAPRIEVENTEFGFQYAAIRSLTEDADKQQVRVTAFMAPFTGYLAGDDMCFFAVPMSDERTMLFQVWYSDDSPVNTEPFRTEILEFFGVDEKTIAPLGLTRATCDSATRASRSNGFYQDRAAMSDGRSFTGLPRFTPEDAAVWESMGRIYNRASGDEHVVPADAAVVRLRRLLLHCSEVVEKGGDPVGLHVDLGQVRGGSGEIRAGQPWQDVVPENVRIEHW